MSVGGKNLAIERYLDFTAHPNIKRPLAAIQLPPTRDSDSCPRGTQLSDKRGNKCHEHKDREYQSKNDNHDGERMAHARAVQITVIEAEKRCECGRYAQRLHPPRLNRPARETTQQR